MVIMAYPKGKNK